MLLRHSKKKEEKKKEIGLRRIHIFRHDNYLQNSGHEAELYYCSLLILYLFIYLFFLLFLFLCRCSVTRLHWVYQDNNLIYLHNSESVF